MDEPHMTSEQIWFLAAIWETRSLALAAKRLGISVATATRLLRSVRSLLQDPLFVRGKGGFVPTNRMTRLMPAIEDAQNALRELARTGEFDPASVRGTLRRGRRQCRAYFSASSLPETPFCGARTENFLLDDSGGLGECS